ncbi:MAG: hypothetical protein HKM89_03910 [Gemmatimonadales bacterium]|nr:hypothetical protein [Gemmatimonadales bacterium]
MRHQALALLVLGTSLNAGPVAGQVSAGVHGDWGSDMDFGVGARAVLGLERLVPNLETVGSFDYFFPGDDFGADVTYWELNLNLVYRFEIKDSPVKPYAGAGLNFAYLNASVDVLGTTASGDETRGGLNLLGGLLFDIGRAKPFVEGRVEAGGGDQFVVSAGVRF